MGINQQELASAWSGVDRGRRQHMNATQVSESISSVTEGPAPRWTACRCPTGRPGAGCSRPACGAPPSAQASNTCATRILARQLIAGPPFAACLFAHADADSQCRNPFEGRQTRARALCHKTLNKAPPRDTRGVLSGSCIYELRVLCFSMTGI